MTTDHTDLGPGGKRLWDSVADEYNLTETQNRLLLEACRAADRLDKINDVLSGDSETWMNIELPSDDGVTIIPILIDKAEAAAVSAANSIKQLLATLGLTDAVDPAKVKGKGQSPGAGKARGAYQKGGKVASIHRGQRKAG